MLELDLRGGLADQDGADPLAAFRGGGLSVLGVERTLRRAAEDRKVRGLLVRLPEGGMAPAAADELRLAFSGFRAAGKPILAHSQGLYQSGLVVSTYRLAAASGDIWMQPDAPFQAAASRAATSSSSASSIAHDVVADFQQRSQYKTAVNPFLYGDYTAAAPRVGTVVDGLGLRQPTWPPRRPTGA